MQCHLSESRHLGRVGGGSTQNLQSGEKANGISNRCLPVGTSSADRPASSSACAEFDDYKTRLSKQRTCLGGLVKVQTRSKVACKLEEMQRDIVGDHRFS